MLPPSGLPYQLFDAAMLLVGICGLWYVFSDPSQVTRSALSDSLGAVLSPHTWGVGLMIVGFVSGSLAYGNHRCIRAGYALMVGACGLWSISLLVGAIAVHSDFDLTCKALGSALLFAWITRRLVTEVIAASQVQQGNSE